MDRLIYTALNAMMTGRDNRLVSAQNLANQNVPGFRRDITQDGEASFLESYEGLTARAFQLGRGESAFSDEPGFIDQTGEPLDIAIPDRGYFYVRPESGDPALSRRGDLRVGLGGALVNGAGEAVLNTNLEPVVLPPFRDIVIDDAGQILIAPIDGEQGVLLPVTQLATVVPADTVKLTKGLDGQIRRPDGTVPQPDGLARVMQGGLERSNVNSTDELIASIELQRSFELNMRMVQSAKEMDEAGARLLRMPES